MTMTRLMGLDVGSKTIGVAVSDALLITAQGIKTIQRKTEEEDLKELKSIMEEYEITKIVVGLPKNVNNTIGESGERSIQFADFLKIHLTEEVVLWDERLTTMEAERLLIDSDVSRKKRKKVIDKLAAVLILQNYMTRFHS